MMKKLRGRNLSHPGCLVGTTIGLTLGIVIAAILAVMNVALNTDLLIWLCLTIGFGAVGWVVGNRLTSRFTPQDEQAPVEETTVQSTSD